MQRQSPQILAVCSVVVDDGEAPCTANLCQQCYNEILMIQDVAPVEELAVESGRGEEGASWQAMENAGKRPVYTRNVGVLLDRKIESEKVSKGC